LWPAVLLAKEVAGIDGVSGGRLTVGFGLGARPDDFVAEGRGPKGLGRRFDADLEIYHRVWRGEIVPPMENPAVPAGTREVPLLFGAFAPKAFERMVKWGQGYIAASVPPPMAAAGFEQAKSAWTAGGREGSPRLLAIAYFGLGDPERARAGIHKYYAFAGDAFADQIAGNVLTTPEAVKDAAKAFADIGTEELILNPGADELDDVKRLAEVVL
jgi:alkanesulfonate monooxygenase SsuD/methylene tetrahydromethanopterin reductase-like flavin-dependent oxidoreductase (luciferase family)